MQFWWGFFQSGIATWDATWKGISQIPFCPNHWGRLYIGCLLRLGQQQQQKKTNPSIQATKKSIHTARDRREQQPPSAKPIEANFQIQKKSKKGRPRAEQKSKEEEESQ